MAEQHLPDYTLARGPPSANGLAAIARPAGPDDVVITDELSRRPPRRPAYKAEARALHALARGLAGEPRAVLRELVTLALGLCRDGTAGVSLLEDTPGGGQVFRWAALAGA